MRYILAALTGFLMVVILGGILALTLGLALVGFLWYAFLFCVMLIVPVLILYALREAWFKLFDRTGEIRVIMVERYGTLIGNHFERRAAQQAAAAEEYDDDYYYD